LRIGVDLMAGDHSPIQLFESVLQAAKNLNSTITWVIFTTQVVINEIQRLYSLSDPFFHRIKLNLAEEVITMDEEPIEAIRKKKNSSLFIGMRLLKKRGIDAFVSTGNSGALIAYGTLFLPHLLGIKRPALLAVLPTLKGSVAIVDVGGNVSCKPHNLVQFAKMGAAYMRCSHGIKTPLVGLLNIGIESKKGTLNLKEAYQLLQNTSSFESKFQFIGNIEGREVFQGNIDVLVTDGFTGNIFLKTSEGVSAFIFDLLRESLSSNTENLLSTIKNVQNRLDYQEFPGALMCGIDRIVIKCHGNSSVKGVFNALKAAANLLENHFLDEFNKELFS
jgi:phosphate acyltransferase